MLSKSAQGRRALSRMRYENLAAGFTRPFPDGRAWPRRAFLVPSHESLCGNPLEFMIPPGLPHSFSPSGGLCEFSLSYDSKSYFSLRNREFEASTLSG